MVSHSNRRVSRAKVKSGCCTCKVRRVKCDEGRPACRRCISTGRICDGYGIWGGGGNLHSHRQRSTNSKDSCVIPQPLTSVLVLTSGTEGTLYFEWFKCRTAIKLPGSFTSCFWSTLLLQASLSEPAILSAVLALSSTHMRGTIDANSQRRSDNIMKEQEKFMLQQHVKAINHLHPHFSRENRASFRVALIACVVFVCLDFLRGHFETAQIHLQNGLNILEQMKLLSNCNNDILRLVPCHEPIDGWIVETFSRLNLQVELFRHTYQHPCVVIQQAACLEISATIFHSIKNAWQQMEWLLYEVLHLTHQSRQQAASKCEFLQHPALVLLKRQQHIQTELARWLNKSKVSNKAQQGLRSEDEEKAYQLLLTYHSMACIMAATSMWPNNELIFDSYTDQFLLLVQQSSMLLTTEPEYSPVQALPGQHMDMSRSIIDIAWIPPLFYTAVKCRVHRIRLQAIRLLESTSHREGIWDAETAACVAKKVMEIEEKDFYKDFDVIDDFPFTSPPHARDLLLPTSPESSRLCEVEVVLSGSPMDKILLFCKRTQEGLDCRVLLSEYSVCRQRWMDT